MDFKKLSAPSLKELFVTELENMILSGKLEIGSQLPSERELAESMGVSRGVVNAGIVEAANKGFLDVKPRIGTFVNDYRRHGTLETLMSIMNYNGGTFRPNEIKSILELRMALDTLAVRLILAENQHVDLSELDNLIIKLKEAADSPEETARAAFNFVHESYVVSGNTLLPLIAYSFKVPILHLWERFGRKHGTHVIYRDLNTFLELVKAEDMIGAIEHVRSSLSEVMGGRYQIYTE